MRIWGDANGNIDDGKAFGPQAAEGDFEGPQRAAEARLAGRDCPAYRRGSWNERNHARDEEVQDLRLALAGTVHGRRSRRPSARQDATIADRSARPAGRRPGC